MIVQIVDELAILAILAHQHILQLESRSIDFYGTVFTEYFADGLNDLSAHGHLFWVEVSGALRSFDLEPSFVLFLLGNFALLALLLS